MAEVKRISNELEDFEQAGLYPGGKGTVKEIRYCLWDYGGKQPPNSHVAVNLHFQPTDGSNEGKEVSDIFWSVGKSSDFQPDATGGHLLGVGSASGIRLGSNWHFVMEKLRNQCGLPKGSLSADAGIRALIGSEMTLTRVDPPERDFQDGVDRKKANKILVPTYAKFPWEQKGGPKPPAAAAAGAAPAAASNSSAPSGAEFDLNAAIEEAAMDAGGSIALADLPKKVLEKMVNVESKSRVPFVKKVKDAAFLQALAAEKGWTLDATTLTTV